MRAPLSSAQRLRGRLSWSRFGVEAGVVAVDVAAFVGIGRLFTSTRPLQAIVVAVLLTHGIAITCRAARIPGPVAALVSFVALSLAVAGAAFHDTISYGFLPSGDTASAVRLSLIEAWDRFTSVRAPTPPLLGFTLTAVAAAWMVGTVSDAIAFRLRYVTEACVPSTVVLIVTSALAPARYRMEVVVGFALALTLLAISARSRELNADAWLGGRPRHNSVFQAVAVAALGLVVAGAVATHPPHWAVNGLVDWRNDRSSGADPERLATNPMVSTRARLVNQSDVEMFKVITNHPTYWRQTALDHYVDESWTGDPIALPRQSGVAPDPPGSWTQTLEITNLRSPWLPVGGRVVRVADPTGVTATDVGIDAGTRAAVVRTDLSDGRRFIITSGPPDPADALISDARRKELLTLPGTVSPRIAELARTITAGATTDTERALLLQRWFIQGFTYDLNVVNDGPMTLESFLFSVKRGYCEQFSGAFAVMARTLGMESRVAVGFIPGTLEADGSYVVRGRDAHAWPELLLAGGWTAFEPTPGRGTPDVTPAPSTTLSPPTTVAPDTATAAVPTTIAVGAGASADPPGRSAGLPFTIGLMMLAVLVAALAPTVVRRLRIGKTPSDPLLRVAAAWNAVEDDLAWLGHVRPAGEPVIRFAHRLHADQSLPDLEALVTRVEEAQYGPVGEATAHSQTVLESLESTHRSLAGRLHAPRRLRRLLAFGLRPRYRVGPIRPTMTPE